MLPPPDNRRGIYGKVRLLDVNKFFPFDGNDSSGSADYKASCLSTPWSKQNLAESPGQSQTLIFFSYFFFLTLARKHMEALSPSILHFFNFASKPSLPDRLSQGLPFGFHRLSISSAQGELPNCLSYPKHT